MADEAVPALETTTVKTETTLNGPVPIEVPRSMAPSYMPGFIAIVLTIGLLSFAGVLMFHEIPKANERIIDTIFGGLIVGCTTAWGYFFGANHASDARSAVRAAKER